MEPPSACLTTFAPASRSLHLCMQNRWWPGNRSLLASVDRANLRASDTIAENAPSAWPVHRLILTAFARGCPAIREPLPQSFGTRGGPSICGGVSRRTCSSITPQLGVRDDQSKLSKLTPPRSFAMRRTQISGVSATCVPYVSAQSQDFSSPPIRKTKRAVAWTIQRRLSRDCPTKFGLNHGLIWLMISYSQPSRCRGTYEAHVDDRWRS